MVEQYSYENAVVTANQHKLIHQYTTFEALEKILSNKSLKLTRTDLLNDTVENNMLFPLWQKKIYVSCFTHRKRESYFFWKTYSRGSSSGVMITLNRQHLDALSIHPDEKCLDAPLCQSSTPNPLPPFDPEVKQDTWGIYDYSIVDVMYMPRNKKIDCVSHFQGRIKYAEWDMEEETRLRIALKPTSLEFKFEKSNLQYHHPQNEYIYAQLSDACIENMVITLSPFADKFLFNRVEQLLRDNGLIDKIQIKPSILTGEAK